MKAQEIAAVLEAFAPLPGQESWDNSGFCIGSPEAEVHGVMVGFDCTAALLREAAARGADMVVTHHPLIFGGLKHIDPDDPVGEAVIEAIRNGIVVYAAHTNADKAPGGVNALMAARLGLVEPEPLDEHQLAFIGLLPAPLSGAAFCDLVKERFSLKMLRCSAPVETVFRVATSCGSGSSFGCGFPGRCGRLRHGRRVVPSFLRPAGADDRRYRPLGKRGGDCIEVRFGTSRKNAYICGLHGNERK